MRRGLAIAGALVLALGIVVELAALPVASRVVGDALGRCLAFEDVEVESIARPVLPRLLAGGARDVELTATGLRLDTVRVQRAHLELPEVALPWAWGPMAAAEGEAILELEFTEADLEQLLEERSPIGLRPVLELTPGVAALGVEPVPARVRLSIEVRDGVLRVAPVGRTPGWFDALGFELTYDVPEGIGLDRLEIRRDALIAVIRVEIVPGLEGSGACGGPLGDAAEGSSG